MPSERLESPLLYIGVDLGREQYRHPLVPGDSEELRELRAQGFPRALLLVVPGEPVVYRGRVEYDDTDLERALREPDRLVDDLLLVVEVVRLEEEDHLHDLLVL